MNPFTTQQPVCTNRLTQTRNRKKRPDIKKRFEEKVFIDGKYENGSRFTFL